VFVLVQDISTLLRYDNIENKRLYVLNNNDDNIIIIYIFNPSFPSHMAISKHDITPGYHD